MKKFRWIALLMGVTILGITGFQLYWLKNNYEREQLSLELLTNASFRQTILELQSTKMKLESIRFGSDEPLFPGRPVFPGMRGKGNRPAPPPREGQKQPPITMINLMQQKMKQYEADSNKKNTIIFSEREMTMMDSLRTHNRMSSITISASGDSLLNLDPNLIREVTVNGQKKEGGTGGKIITIDYGTKPSFKVKKDSTSKISRQDFQKNLPRIISEDIVEKGQVSVPARKDAVFRFLYNIDSVSIKDSVTIKEINNAYAAKLKESKMNLSFAVSRLDSSSRADSAGLDLVTIGFAKPISYRLSLKNETSYILKKLTLPIIFSLFLVGLTIVSFVLLYRSLLKQQRLAELKNQFISNITHELKTPIATVGVAIEALKNFNAIHDPERTKEYLDISQNELHRLSLLVDKVLKLSMFENRELELKKEQFDCKQLVEEVMNSMKLQFDKYHTKVKLHTEGSNFSIDADKLHITSVIYNLLDNALKYSKENPVIDVKLASYPEYIEFSVSDNGIGIEPAYKEKIFDKFFRVPTGDKHNIKGYGLGLSYVAEVIKRHHGYVYAESEFGKGSTFIARMPNKETAVIRFDDKRSIRKEGKIL
jgi:two-component system phosphate regulon sensor histidine kinase PhoR